MSRLANDDAGIAVPVLAVIVAVVFIAVLFFKFVELVGPSSGSGSLRRSAKPHPRLDKVRAVRALASC